MTLLDNIMGVIFRYRQLSCLVKKTSYCCCYGNNITLLKCQCHCWNRFSLITAWDESYTQNMGQKWAEVGRDYIHYTGAGWEKADTLQAEKKAGGKLQDFLSYSNVAYNSKHNSHVYNKEVYLAYTKTVFNNLL